MNWKRRSIIGRACATVSESQNSSTGNAENPQRKDFKYLLTSLQCRYFEIKMRHWRKEVSRKKNEKFCWTPEQVLCDNGKPAPKSNRSSNSCFNYENTTHYLSLFTRLRVGFARTSSTSGAGAAGNRRYKSGCARTDGT